MDVSVRVAVGDFALEADISDCGPDAVGDVMRQITTHTIVMVGSEALVAAAGIPSGIPDVDGDDD